MIRQDPVGSMLPSYLRGLLLICYVREPRRKIALGIRLRALDLKKPQGSKLSSYPLLASTWQHTWITSNFENIVSGAVEMDQSNRGLLLTWVRQGLTLSGSSRPIKSIIHGLAMWGPTWHFPNSPEPTGRRNFHAL